MMYKVLLVAAVLAVPGLARAQLVDEPGADVAVARPLPPVGLQPPLAPPTVSGSMTPLDQDALQTPPPSLDDVIQDEQQDETRDALDGLQDQVDQLQAGMDELRAQMPLGISAPR
jgi:hypothetical protein